MSRTDIEAALAECLVDAYDADEQLTALHTCWAEAGLPVEGRVVGVAVTVEDVTMEGHRCELVARCRRGGKGPYRVALADLEFDPTSSVAMLHAVYRHWLGVPYEEPPHRAPQRFDDLLTEVTVFEGEAMEGRYYEGFNVNSKNWMEKSDGTRRFITAFRRFEKRCFAAADAGRDEVAGAAANTLIDLLIAIGDDFNTGKVIFLADEYGWWQVGANDERLLQVQLRWLARQLDANDFADAVMEVVEGLSPWTGPTEYRAVVLGAALPEQVAVVEERLHQAGSSRR